MECLFDIAPTVGQLVVGEVRLMPRLMQLVRNAIID